MDWRLVKHNDEYHWRYDGSYIPLGDKPFFATLRVAMDHFVKHVGDKGFLYQFGHCRPSGYDIKHAGLVSKSGNNVDW